MEEENLEESNMNDSNYLDDTIDTENRLESLLLRVS